MRVVLPSPLRALSGAAAEVTLDVPAPVTIAAVLDVVEQRWPMLRGTIRDHEGGARRAFVRFYANGADWSHHAMDTPLPAVVQRGELPLLVVGAMAGG
ncbi:MAG: MoaD/ThiS family protein [Gemmatimonadaceae bacterium]|nr:MoaD/ThiS family protein [Gemmatimonadaceae bacterium]